MHSYLDPTYQQETSSRLTEPRITIFADTIPLCTIDVRSARGIRRHADRSRRGGSLQGAYRLHISHRVPDTDNMINLGGPIHALGINGRVP